MKRLILVIIALLGMIILSACNFNTSENATPTADDLIEEPINPLPERTEPGETPSASPTVTVTLSPTLTPTEPAPAPVEVTTNTPSPSPIPSATPLPSATPGPIEHIMQAEETLLFIIQLYGYSLQDDFQNAINQIIRINDNVPNADILPGPGSVILIPRPTAQPLPANAVTNSPDDITSAATSAPPNATVDDEGIIIVPPDDPNLELPPRQPRLGLPSGSYVGCHEVREGETVIGIQEQYAGLTLDVFARLNPTLGWGGCNFEIASGGPTCSPDIRPNTCVNVLLPTPTPTLSPTPSGNETATPTPTYAPPRIISPVDGSILSAGVVTLYWVSVGALEAEEAYLIQVSDLTTGESTAFTTRDTQYRLPTSLIPSDGETHSIMWSVSVAVPNANGQFVPIGAQRSYTFQWQSR